MAGDLKQETKILDLLLGGDDQICAISSAIALLSRAKRAKYVAWVIGPVSLKGGAHLLGLDVDSVAQNDALHQQLEQITSAARADPPAQPARTTGPLKQIVSFDIFVPDRHRLYLGALSDKGWDRAAELTRLETLGSLVSSAPKQGQGSADHGLDPLIQLEMLRLHVAEIFAHPAVPVATRLSAMLAGSCHAMALDRGVITRKTAKGHMIRHLSTPHENPSLIPPSPCLTDTIASSSDRFIHADLAATKFAHLPNIEGDLPASILGAPIEFDGQVQGTIELFGTHARDAPFEGWQKLAVSALATYAAPYLFLMD